MSHPLSTVWHPQHNKSDFFSSEPLNCDVLLSRKWSVWNRLDLPVISYLKQKNFHVDNRKVQKFRLMLSLGCCWSGPIFISVSVTCCRRCMFAILVAQSEPRPVSKGLSRFSVRHMTAYWQVNSKPPSRDAARQQLTRFQRRTAAWLWDSPLKLNKGPPVESNPGPRGFWSPAHPVLLKQRASSLWKWVSAQETGCYTEPHRRADHQQTQNKTNPNLPVNH